MTSSTVSALPQQSEAARILNPSGEGIWCASLYSSAWAVLVLAYFHHVCGGAFFKRDHRLCCSARGPFGVNHSAVLRHHRAAGGIKHSVRVSSEDRRVDNCAISDSGVA